MNILVLTNEYPYDKYPRKNWTKTVNYFAREWVKQGHRVVAIVNATYFPSAYYGFANTFKGVIGKHYDIDSSDIGVSTWAKPFSFTDEGVEVFNLPMKKYLPGAPFGEKKMEEQIERIKSTLTGIAFVPEAITGHWVNPQLELISRLKSVYGCKTAFVFHIDYSEDKCKKFNAAKWIECIDNPGCRSRSDAAKITGWLPLKKQPFVCPSGIPDSFIEQYAGDVEKAFDNSCPKIITVGRLVKYKQYPAVIKACYGAFGAGNYKLDIVGDGPLMQELRNEAASVDANGTDIKFWGKIPREQVQDKMHESDIFVMISVQETFGMVYLEAMVHGCIVIGSKEGGIDGIIVHGENGFLCEEGNAEELTELLKEINALPIEKKKDISKKAIETAKQYADSLVAKRYLENIIA